MDPYAQIAEAIIQKQVLVLQDMALARARSVQGLELDAAGHVKAVTGGKDVIEALIKQYQELLGPAGISFARDAAHPIILKNPSLPLPQALL